LIAYKILRVLAPLGVGHLVYVLFTLDFISLFRVIGQNPEFLLFDVDDVDEKVNKSFGSTHFGSQKSLGFGLHHLHQNNRIE
jgi:hypothetical protein